jgi:DNA repair protein RadC
MHEGHRMRIRQKAEKGELAEHEWLELLLFNAIPRRNTNEIAHALILRFGSVQGVFSASVEDLESVKGVGESVASYLHTIGHFYKNFHVQEEKRYYGRFEHRGFLAFVNDAYKDVEVEVLDLYLLNGDGRVTAKKRFSVEDLYSVKVIPEEISAFLLTREASGVVMVHNHPCGEAFPSKADDTMTKNCQVLCSMHNRLLCDHVIYAPNGVYSYYLSDCMQSISKQYSIGNFTPAE